MSGYLCSASYIGRLAPPGYPKMISTPSLRRHSMMISAPLSFVVMSVLPSARDPAGNAVHRVVGLVPGARTVTCVRPEDVTGRGAALPAAAAVPRGEGAIRRG